MARGSLIIGGDIAAPSEDFFEMTDAEMRPFVMRHDCATGCWNNLHRPRLELLKKCFGGLDTKIKPQDIDGSVERNGYFLFLEFKGERCLFEDKSGRRRKTALDRYYQSMTEQRRIIHRQTMTLSSPTTTAVYVVGNSQTMAIEEIKVIFDGAIYDWEGCDLYGLQSLCWRWYEWTDTLRRADLDRARADVRAASPPNPWLTRRLA